MQFEILYLDLVNSSISKDWDKHLKAIEELGIKTVEIRINRINEFLIDLIAKLQDKYVNVIIDTRDEETYLPKECRGKVCHKTSLLQVIEEEQGQADIIFNFILSPATVDKINVNDLCEMANSFPIEISVPHYKRYYDETLKRKIADGFESYWDSTNISKLKDFIRELKRVKSKVNIEFPITSALLKVPEYDLDRAISLSIKKCATDKKTLSADGEGRLKVCPDYQGNCRDFRLATLPKMLEDFLRIREQSIKVCNGCVWNEE